VLFAVASLTDAFDGHLARRWRVESVFGTLADPFADKLLILGSLVALAAVDRIAAWIVVIIAAREIWATVLRTYARRHGVVIAAGPLGKAKMVVQVLTVFAVIAFDLTGAALAIPLYAMVAITVASGVEIALRARRRLTAPVPARATRVVAGAPAGRMLSPRTRRLESPPVTPDAATPHSPLGKARARVGADGC
jgi:CDP-diacylglycerol--glycerol-3-phosphate 3-phosphatidyltransferase